MKNCAINWGKICEKNFFKNLGKTVQKIGEKLCKICEKLEQKIAQKIGKNCAKFVRKLSKK